MGPQGNPWTPLLREHGQGKARGVRVRSAPLRNISDFPDQFSPRAAVISLEHNYRSTQPILDAANAVIAQAPEGFSKTPTSSKLSAQLPHLVTVEDEIAPAV